jgi:hypothetical protein
MNKTIIKEEEVIFDDLQWKKITYDDNEVIYKRFDEKYDSWIIFKFKKPLA